MIATRTRFLLGSALLLILASRLASDNHSFGQEPAAEPTEKKASKKKPSKKVVGKIDGLEELWSIPGEFACSSSTLDWKEIYAFSRYGRVGVLDQLGKEKRLFKTKGGFGHIYPARLKGGRINFVGTGLANNDGRSLIALAPDGKKTWEIPGVDFIQSEMCVADLNGDNQDEVVVYTNNIIQVFSGEGKAIWSHDRSASRLPIDAQVGVGDIDGDGTREVIATPSNKLIAYNALDGRQVRSVNQPFKMGIFRTVSAKSVQMPGGDAIIVAGKDGPDAFVTALNGNMNFFWTQSLVSLSDECRDMSISPDGTLIAIAGTWGFFAVIDIRTGNIIAQAIRQGDVMSVAWGKQPDNKPLLLVCSDKKFAAYKLKKSPTTR